MKIETITTKSMKLNNLWIFLGRWWAGSRDCLSWTGASRLLLGEQCPCRVQWCNKTQISAPNTPTCHPTASSPPLANTLHQQVCFIIIVYAKFSSDALAVFIRPLLVGWVPLWLSWRLSVIYTWFQAKCIFIICLNTLLILHRQFWWVSYAQISTFNFYNIKSQ